MLHERKIESGYGDSVVKRLSADLKERYPKMGVSPRNLWYMKKFYERYAGHDEKVQRCVALLPWSHHLLTRFACYLISQNGDRKNEETAFAHGCFALQTRRADSC